MADGSIVYEVRVSSDNVAGDLDKAGSLLEKGTQTITRLAADTAQIFSKMLSDVFGNSVNFAERSVERLGTSFDKLKNKAPSLLSALTPVSKELEKISKLNLDNVGEVTGKIAAKETQKSKTANTVSSLNLPSFAVGTSYVPYDDFPALLHKGEAVLTASENAALKAAGGIGALNQSEPLNMQNNVNISDDISRRPVEVTLKIGEYEFTQIIADTMNNLYRQWGENPLR
ncbi:MAG: hypothetical protein LBC86_04335 [Oscillospiraceae bacterium]|jgi:hypothetical protein|nr:hypothetical protein [Oscillospiraceae bacterium]